jgi:hypothetical protein
MAQPPQETLEVTEVLAEEEAVVFTTQRLEMVERAVYFFIINF